MKKLLISVCLVIMVLSVCNCISSEQEKNQITKYYTAKENPVEISLIPGDTAVAPGIQVLGTLTVSSTGKNQLYGLDMEILTDNYYLYGMVPLFDKIWLENDAQEIVLYQDGKINYSLWGVYDLPEGESTLYLMGDIGFGQYPATIAPLDPAPAFKIKINEIYTSGELSHVFPLTGNSVYPKYNGTNKVYSSLHPASASGTISNNRYELLIFNLWTDHGDALFWDLGFAVNKDFKGRLENCQLRNVSSDTYLSDISTWDADYFMENFVNLDRLADNLPWARVTSKNQTFSLICDVYTYEANQTLIISYAYGYWSPGESGDFLTGFPDFTGNPLYVP